ncbi:MAG: cytidine deaminase [Anditalea sp.]
MSKKIEKTVTLDILTWKELGNDIQSLVLKAKASAENAHAPYSNFMVGAALLLENGEIFTANNQENVSFPVGICAERVVLSYVQANFPDIIPTKIAIAAKRRNQTEYATVTPCGICRQTISEYEQKFKRPIEVYMLTPKGEVLKAPSMDDLLPFKFSDING